MTTIQATKKLVRPTKTTRRVKCPKLTTEDLRNDAKVLQWIAATQTTPINVFDAKLFDIFAAAECALDHGENPPALFVWIVNGKRWDLLTNSQDDAARQRVLRIRNPEHAAERKRLRQLGEDFAPAFSEPLFAGDVARELINKLFPGHSSEPRP